MDDIEKFGPKDTDNVDDAGEIKEHAAEDALANEGQDGNEQNAGNKSVND